MALAALNNASMPASIVNIAGPEEVERPPRLPPSWRIGIDTDVPDGRRGVCTDARVLAEQRARVAGRFSPPRVGIEQLILVTADWSDGGATCGSTVSSNRPRERTVVTVSPAMVPRVASSRAGPRDQLFDADARPAEKRPAREPLLSSASSASRPVKATSVSSNRASSVAARRTLHLFWNPRY